ncbi:MAG TPA: hypothetical protein VFQ61_11985 [Polyangiaceae bacterium]|nr:hypothetical protein [Polyangiaceae bacterium]
MQAFQDLGQSIQALWKNERFELQAFARIASAALHGSQLHQRVKVTDLLEWLRTTPCLPEQHDLAGKFAQPPLTVYRGDGFFIDALFWNEATTSIHQHRFSGAFSVLSGSSLHTEYSFEQRERINQRLLLGDLRLRQIELLQEGDVRPIHSGSAFIHSVFHLERPTVSVVVRTIRDPGTDPQYDYHRPGLAIDAHGEYPRRERLRQTFELLKNGIPAQYLPFVREVALDDPELAYWALGHAYGRCTAEEWAELVSATAKRHGPAIHRFVESFEERAWERQLIARRANTTVADQRFFLAVLLNAPDRSTARDLIQARFPHQGADEALVDLTFGLHSKSGSELSPATHEFVRLVLTGADFGDVMTQLDQRYASAEIRAQAPALESLHGSFRSSPLFRRLFVDSAA